MRHASTTSSRISASSIASSHTRTQLYRSSEATGMWNFSGSLATSAARSSLGNANPIDASSGEIETKTSLPTRNLTWSRISRSSLRGSEPANRRTSSAMTIQTTPPQVRLPARHEYRDIRQRYRAPPTVPAMNGELAQMQQKSGHEWKRGTDMLRHPASAQAIPAWAAPNLLGQ